ncbi:MAG: polysaccharide pyruvyl transferase family protein [Spirochaetia bacterium]|nr:polysaccharide pyruvyl transferase family protein [Spirochaetia bacterium]
MVVKLMKKIYLFFVRNKRDILRRKITTSCTLEWWSEQPNVGDGLAPVIFDWMLARKNINRDNFKGHILTVGSLVGMGAADSVVWGTGLMNSVNFMRLVKDRFFIKYDIRAVRGPLTRDAFLSAGYSCPEIYGDPAILLPFIYKPKTTEKKYQISIINHHLNQGKSYPDVHEIDVNTYDYKNFINEILSSEKIISSSLHGIIIAETYGVPAIFLNEGESVFKQSMKYLDWYFSTNRYNVRMASSLEEALMMDPMEIPELSKMQEALLDSFPYDIFKN